MSFSIAAASVWIVPLAFGLAVWVLLTGADDLLVDFFAMLAKLRRAKAGRSPTRTELEACSQRAIAILTPLWKESAVIAGMVQQNSDRIRYQNYHFFVGAYPNDTDTVHIVSRLERQYMHVHLALCPHEGPTSKADCLNWAYQRLIAYEKQTGSSFDIVMIHDAEDVIHAESLLWVNHFAESHHMVQVPVLPLPTPWRDFTHGLYCDEFTEYQHRDMPARQFMGAFVPSNGVGTAFRRDALERLAEAEGSRIFEPRCLTEDYENGLRLRTLGAQQLFLCTQNEGMATREFFPRRFRTAVKQRTRWITGIALQTWERHGWQGSFVQKYWFWRDRKSLLGNPLSLLVNLVFLWSCFAWACGHPLPWHPIYGWTALLGAYRTGYRMNCVRQTFGWRFAVGVLPRTVYGNAINALSTFRALKQFASAKLQRRPLVWVKTEHAFPSQAELSRVANHPLQLPQCRVEPTTVRKSISRALPLDVSRKWNLFPFRVEYGNLLVAVTETLSEAAETDVRRYTRLGIRAYRVTAENYHELVESLND